MKKIITIILVLTLALCSAIALSACNKIAKEFESIDATDLLQEDFGIAVTKGNTTLMNEINNVINTWIENGNMDKYMDYYEAVYEETDEVTPVPTGLAVAWDFGAATEEITVYTESGFAPYEFIYDNNVIGVDIAIMSQVALNMGKKINVQDVSFDTIPTLVSTAQGDAVGAAGLTINAERSQIVDFSEVYSSSTLVIVSAKGSGFDSVSKLAGKKVGVQQGTSGDLIISAAITETGHVYNDGENNVTVKAAGASISRYAQYALVLADLQNGRIDAILMDKIPAKLLLMSIA